MNSSITRWLVPVLTSLAAGCASTAEPRYYVLEAAPGAATSQLAPGGEILLEPVSIPAQLDRPQIVLSRDAAEVRIDDGHRWAAPLQSDITQVLACDLASSLGSSNVVTDPGTLPWTGDRIEVEILAFESRLGHEASIEARWTVRRGNQRRSGRVRLEEAAPGEYDALVQAHSRALARLAREITASVSALDSTPTPPKGKSA